MAKSPSAPAVSAPLSPEQDEALEQAPAPSDEFGGIHGDLLSTRLRPSMRRRWLVFAMVAIAVVLGDQTSKAYAVLELTHVRLVETERAADRIDAFLWQRHPYPIAHKTLVKNCFDLRYIENPGAAWGFLSRSGAKFRTPMFLCISVLSMVLVVGYFRRTKEHQRAVRLALALVFGGAIGNFADRVRLGYVIDFIDWHIYERFHWPTFNVADAAITIGALLLLIDMLTHPPKVPHGPPEL